IKPRFHGSRRWARLLDLRTGLQPNSRQREWLERNTFKAERTVGVTEDCLRPSPLNAQRDVDTVLGFALAFEQIDVTGRTARDPHLHLLVVPRSQTEPLPIRLMWPHQRNHLVGLRRQALDNEAACSIRSRDQAKARGEQRAIESATQRRLHRLDDYGYVRHRPTIRVHDITAHSRSLAAKSQLDIAVAKLLDGVRP